MVEGSPFERRSEFFDEAFDGIECRECHLDGKEFNGCTFVGVQLAGSTLSMCKFVDCTFRRCDLSNILVKGCTWKDVTFEDSKLLGVNWTAGKVVTHLTFRRSTLNFSNFSGLDLRNSVVAECVAREVELGHTNLSEADCRKTDFSGARFSQTNLSKCDFREAVNYAIRPDDNMIKKTRFSMPEATALLYGMDIILDE